MLGIPAEALTALRDLQVNVSVSLSDPENAAFLSSAASFGYRLDWAKPPRSESLSALHQQGLSVFRH